MSDRQVLNSCPCGQTYNPENSAARCPLCQNARSISRAPEESADDFEGRLRGITGKKYREQLNERTK